VGRLGVANSVAWLVAVGEIGVAESGDVGDGGCVGVGVGAADWVGGFSALTVGFGDAAGPFLCASKPLESQATNVKAKAIDNTNIIRPVEIGTCFIETSLGGFWVNGN
jgi:hypothetical protein